MSDLRAFGADISHHQGRFQFRDNLDFIILRASVGLTPDRRFQQFLLEAQRVPVRGAYHYLRSDSPWQDQLDLFLSITGGRALHFLALDFEKIDNQRGRPLVEAALRWLDAIDARANLPVLLYTNPSTWDEWLRPFLIGDELERLARREVWIAQWPHVPNDTLARTSGRPGLGTGMRQWTVWQFSGDASTHPNRGAEFGVGSDKIDLDVFNGTREAMQLRFTGQVTPVQPVDDPVDEGEAGGPIEPVIDHTTPARAPFTNQDMINAFFRVGEALGQPGFDLIQRCGLASMAIPESNRRLPYSGPAVDAISGLTAEERAALRTTLGGQMLKRNRAPAPNPNPTDATFITWEHRAVPGLHGPADPGGGWVPEAFDVVRQSKVRAVKVLVPDVQPSEVAQLRANTPGLFVMARLFSGQLGERRGDDGTPEGTGRWFANEVAAPGDGNNPMLRALSAGIRYFEVHNEPNLTTEGLGVNWQTGQEFARFFQTVVASLRPRFPEAKFGFPGLSPGPVNGPRQMDGPTFLQQAHTAVEQADFLCSHVYWGQEGVDLPAAVAQLRAFCTQFPRQRIICSEFSNNHPHVPHEAKADQYFQFYEACKALPSNLGAMFAYALSWRDDVNNEGFLQLHADGHWHMTPKAGRLGAHNF